MLEKRFPLILDDVETLNKCWKEGRLLTKKILAEKLSIASSEFTVGSKILSDLGGDSLDLVEIAIALEKVTGIRVNERLSFDYVSELIDYMYFIRIWEPQKINKGE